MISNKVFVKNIALLSLNFDFKMREGYDSFIYSQIKDKSNDEQFSKAIQDIITKTTKDEWNKKYGFGGVMSLADFTQFLSSNNVNIDYEIELLIEKADFYGDKIPTFDNQITQLVANSKLKQVRFDLYDNFNLNKKAVEAVKKDLKSYWLIIKNNYDSKQINTNMIETNIKTKDMQKTNLDNDIEKLVLQFVIDNKAKCEFALKDCWLGYPWKSGDGLLGYMRYSFNMQNKILLLEKKQITEKDYIIAIPFHPQDAKLIVPFFLGDYFKSEVIKNNDLKPFYKKEHFEIIKKRKLVKFNIMIDDFIDDMQKRIQNN